MIPEQTGRVRNNDDHVDLTASGISWLRQTVRDQCTKFSVFYYSVASTDGLCIEPKSFERAFQRSLSSGRMPRRYLGPVAEALGIDSVELVLRLQTDEQGYPGLPIDSMQFGVFLWSQLRTQPICLGVHVEHDDLREVFSMSDQLFQKIQVGLGAIPVMELRGSPVSRRIFEIGCDVSNAALRPYLNKWKGKFLAWVRGASGLDENVAGSFPGMQSSFPQIRQLEVDLRLAERKLLQLRGEVEDLLFGNGGTKPSGSVSD